VRQAAHEAENPRPPPTEEEIARDQAIISSLEQAFGLVGLVSNQVSRGAESVRQGLGIPIDWDEPGEQEAGEQDRARFEELTRL